MVIRNCFSEKKLPLTKTSRIRSLTCFKHQTNMNVAPIFVGISLVSESSTKNSFQKLDTLRLLKIYNMFHQPAGAKYTFFQAQGPGHQNDFSCQQGQRIFRAGKILFLFTRKSNAQKEEVMYYFTKISLFTCFFFQILSFPVLLFAHLSNTASPFCDRVLMLM